MNKETPKSKKDNNMKKTKNKIPVVKTEPTANSVVNDMCKEFDKMTPEEKEKFNQQTLENLRNAVRNIVDGKKAQQNIIRPSRPTTTYALNSSNKSLTPPENDIYSLIKQKPLSEKETEMLKCRIAEYLKNFVIFGYDLNGNRVLLTGSNTNQDNDSIIEMSKHIPAVLFSIFNGRPPDIGDLF